MVSTGLFRKASPLLVVMALVLMSTSGWQHSAAQEADVTELLQKIRQMKAEALAEREASIKELGPKLTPLMQYTIEELQLALTIKITATYDGAKVIAADNERTYLGQVADEFSSNSIFNDFGTYGNEFSSTSIWNDFGLFGGKFSVHSPFNAFSSTPPFLVKDGRVVGWLTVNKYLVGAIDPMWLKPHFTY